MSRGYLPPVSDATVADILQDLYAGTLDETAWDRALVRITDMVGGAGVVLLALNPSNGAVLRDEVHRFDPQVARDFIQRWAEKDIRVPLGVSLPPGIINYGEMTLSSREWRKSEIYNDFLIPNDSPHHLTTWSHKGPTKCVAFTVQGTTRHGPFEESDATRLRPFVPHLQRAIDIRDRLEAANIRASALASSMDRLTFGLIALDEVGGIIEANAVAEELLRSEPGISVGSDRTLRLSGPSDAELRRWILKGITADSRPDHLVQIARRDGRQPMSLMITPMPHLPVRWTSMDPRWIVFLFDPELHVMPVATVLAQELGISAREAEVAAHLSSGKSLKQISRCLSISDHTVRTHLKAIYAKTGLKSQVDLVRRVVTGPAMQSQPAANLRPSADCHET
jgi:DNA-binding CsgD family transcriptional regulator